MQRQGDVRVATCCDAGCFRLAGNRITVVTSENERELRLTCWESLRKSARRGAAGGFCVLQASLRRGLGVHVDDLNSAVDRVHRRVRMLRLGLAIANGD